jgi:hypothetical protein
MTVLVAQAILPVPQLATCVVVVKREKKRTCCLILQVWRELRRAFTLAQAGLPVLLTAFIR